VLDTATVEDCGLSLDNQAEAPLTGDAPATNRGATQWLY